MKEINHLDKKDITLDFQVITYLKEGILSEDQIESNRVKRRSINYILNEDRVYYIGKNGLRLIPTIAERPNLVKERHSVAGHQSV